MESSLTAQFLSAFPSETPLLSFSRCHNAIGFYMSFPGKVLNIGNFPCQYKTWPILCSIPKSARWLKILESSSGGKRPKWLVSPCLPTIRCLKPFYNKIIYHNSTVLVITSTADGSAGQHYAIHFTGVVPWPCVVPSSPRRKLGFSAM